jgi:hypothetical protein
MEAFGTLTLPISIKVDAANYDEALRKIYELINDLNIHITGLDIPTVSGKIHKVKVHDYNITWDEIF